MYTPTLCTQAQPTRHANCTDAVCTNHEQTKQHENKVTSFSLTSFYQAHVQSSMAFQSLSICWSHNSTHNCVGTFQSLYLPLTHELTVTDHNLWLSFLKDMWTVAQQKPFSKLTKHMLLVQTSSPEGTQCCDYVRVFSRTVSETCVAVTRSFTVLVHMCTHCHSDLTHSCGDWSNYHNVYFTSFYSIKVW